MVYFVFSQKKDIPQVSVSDTKIVLENIVDTKTYIRTMEVNGKLLENQGFTYNEAGKTYNESLMTYGGAYGLDGPKAFIQEVYDN